MNQIIKNDFLTVAVDPLGAQLASIKDQAGTEHLWQGDPAYWADRAPVLFPIVGGLIKDQYELDGATYTLPKHGFAKKMVFEVTDKSADSVSMAIKDDANTRTIYPFAFCFTVKFQLLGKQLAITYTIENKSATTQYASFGAHEGFNCPEGPEAYELRFEQEEKLATCGVDGNLLNNELTPVLEKGAVLPLKNSYFEIDALIFTTIRSQAVTLAKRGGGRAVRVDFPGVPYLAIWTRPSAPFVCIEPWCGLPDETVSSGKIAEKRGIMAVPAGETPHRKHTITFEG